MRAGRCRTRCAGSWWARSPRRCSRNALIAWTLELRRTLPELYRTAEIALPVCALLCLAVGLTDWGAKASLAAMVVLLLVPVAAGTAVWLKHSECDTLELG